MEWSTTHDCGDCLTGICQHPDHHLLDCDVDLDYLLALTLHRQRFDELIPEIAWAPVIL